MFTKFFYKLLNYQLRITIRLGGCPAGYNEKTRILYSDRKTKLKFWKYVVSVGMFTIFVAIQLARMKLTGNEQEFHFTISFFYAGVISLCAFSLWATSDTPKAVNGLQKYSRDFHGKQSNKILVYAMELNVYWGEVRNTSHMLA